PPWEGITWVLDLLPGFPQAAVDAAGAYLLAHAQVLPDGRYAGLTDALALIRSRYIGQPGHDAAGRTSALLTLAPRAYERIIERYLHAQKYQTLLTAPGNDGGRDIIATRPTPPPQQAIHVECKNWADRVGRPRAQQLLGVVTASKATTGLLVATSGF